MIKIIVVIAIIFSAVYTSPTCTKANYCMGCAASPSADTCTSCYNWVAGTIGAKALNASTNDCKTSLNYIVTYAKYYSGTHFFFT